MVADYDLSNLPTDQAEVWICLHADNICSQIMAAQAERLGFPVHLGPPHRLRHDPEPAVDLPNA